MMTDIRMAALVLLSASVSAVIPFVNNANSVDMNQVLIHLNGTNEVPPVDTIAKGILKFQFSPDGRSVTYQLNVTNIDGVTGAQIHEGRQGENGDTIVALFNPEKTLSPTSEVNGSLAKGDLSLFSSTLEGPLVEKSVSDLIDLIYSGRSYVDIQTIRHPQGEIRGQILIGNVTE